MKRGLKTKYLYAEIKYGHLTTIYQTLEPFYDSYVYRTVYMDKIKDLPDSTRQFYGVPHFEE